MRSLPSQNTFKSQPSSGLLPLRQQRNSCRHTRLQQRCAAVKAHASLSISQPGDDAHDPARVDYAPKDRKQLWMAAIKPPMYSVGIVPVLVGAAAAKFEHGVVAWPQCAALVLAAICVIAWLNLSNDAFDAATGVDVHKHESFVNITGNRNGVLLTAKLFLAAGLSLLAANINTAHDPRVLSMLGAAIVCGYVYQGPPFRFSYKGLGEPLCFMAFGPLATTAFYLAHSPAHTTVAGAAGPAAAATGSGVSSMLADVSPLVWLLAVLVGITTTVILFCSHWHQIQGDIRAGKMSPLVRLGTDSACQVLLAATAAPYLVALAAAAAGACPTPLLGCLLLSLPAAKSLLDFAFANHTVPAQIAPLKKYGVRWHVAMGLSLVAGLLIS
ncbi:UbiA prenyltransferase family-domain-containing protein [Scenedesmus sp. NREL 46B-D3]|nr:UbiA prenyltransferase family-domain-containing protein [Scenedesmus sp. NREL 46B-D3]